MLLLCCAFRAIAAAHPAPPRRYHPAVALSIFATGEHQQEHDRAASQRNRHTTVRLVPKSTRSSRCGCGTPRTSSGLQRAASTTSHYFTHTHTHTLSLSLSLSPSLDLMVTVEVGDCCCLLSADVIGRPTEREYVRGFGSFGFITARDSRPDCT